MSDSPTPTPPAALPPSSRGWCPCPRCRCRGLLWPVMVITVGVLFLMAEFTRFDFGDTWPVLLIVLGVVKLLEFSASSEGHRG